MEHPRRNAGERAHAQGQKHVAQLADGRIGEDAFQVGLGQGDQGGQKRGEPADCRHHALGVGRGRKQRRAAGHHVDARRDHRRRVDQRANRRGAFHGVGQPDVQGELGALAAGPRHQQQADRRAQPATHVERRIVQHRLAEDAGMDHAGDGGVLEIQRAVGDPEEEYTQGEAEIAHPIDQKGLQPRGRGRRLLEPETDQQVAAQAHRLPEDIEEQEVAGRDQHGHGEDEQADVGEESPIAHVSAHVADRVDGHQQRDERHRGEHDGRERIGPQDDVDVKGRAGVRAKGPLSLRERARVRAGLRLAFQCRSPHPLPLSRRERGGRDARPGPEGNGLEIADGLLRAAVGGKLLAVALDGEDQQHAGGAGSGDGQDHRQMAPGAEHVLAQRRREQRGCQRQSGNQDQQRADIKHGVAAGVRLWEFPAARRPGPIGARSADGTPAARLLPLPTRADRPRATAARRRCRVCRCVGRA